MGDTRYCARCGADVVPSRQQLPIPGSAKSVVHLDCPQCGRRLGSRYDEELEVAPVRGVKIAR